MGTKIKDIITISLIGIMMYIMADTIHEVIGHSFTCLMLGCKITMLSSVYFRSDPGNYLVSLGGPLSNLLFGLLILSFLSSKKDLTPLSRFRLILLMAYNLFLFSGTIISSTFSNAGDWTFALKKIVLGKSILFYTWKRTNLLILLR